MSVDWTKWAAIGQLVGAAGTLAAVVTSLWLSNRSSRPRLKITCGIRLLIGEGDQAPFPELIQFSIRNVGERDAHVEQIGWRTGGWPFHRPGWIAPQFAIQLFGTVAGSANPPFIVPVGQRRDSLLSLPQTIENISTRSGRDPFFARQWPYWGLRRTKIRAVVHLANGLSRSSQVEPDLEVRLLAGECAKQTNDAEK
jgi:hypothetical protein